MKNIIKQFKVIAVGTLLVFSCTYDDSEWVKLTDHAPDPSAGYYVEFDNNVLDAQTGVDANDNPINVKSTILVKLMGLPQDEGITATITADAASTMTSDMYTLSTTSVTIPAGETSASIDFSTVAENMPECEAVTLILNLDAGDHTTPSNPGKKVNYKVRKISPSPLANGVADLAGSWGVVESYTNGVYFDEGSFSASWDGTYLIASGLGGEFIKNFWAETVVAGGDCNMTVTEDGTITIPRQYIFTTVYDGDNYDYEIEGSGSWVSLCGEAPVMKLQYDIYYVGDADGLAAIYAGYLGAPYLGAKFVLN